MAETAEEKKVEEKKVSKTCFWCGRRLPSGAGAHCSPGPTSMLVTRRQAPVMGAGKVVGQGGVGSTKHSRAASIRRVNEAKAAVAVSAGGGGNKTWFCAGSPRCGAGDKACKRVIKEA